MAQPEFRKWPSTPRLFRDITITEKIDGTNSCVIVSEDGTEVWAQSRKRLITPDDDNFGFAHWVFENAGALADTLGPGYHYGEWWGKGIQRGYGMEERRFSLFNTSRWCGEESIYQVDGLSVVPMLYRGPFSEWEIEHALEELLQAGSVAALGFDDPEGVVVYHEAANQPFKVTLDGNDVHKYERRHLTLAYAS